MIKFEVKCFNYIWKIKLKQFFCYASSKLILLYHTKQLIGGGHEEIYDEKLGHGTKWLGTTEFCI